MTAPPHTARLGIGFLLALALSGLVVHLLLPDHRLPITPDRRFAGALRSSGDVLWVKVAGRIPFMERIGSREAELNYNLLRMAGRLNPANTEAWRHGALGLCLWGRPDLGYALILEGCRRHPADTSFQFALMTTMAVNERDSAHVLPVLDRMVESRRDFPAPDPVRAVLLQLKAAVLEQDSRPAEALTAWREMLVECGDDEMLRWRAEQQIKRMENYLSGGTLPPSH